MAPYPSTTIKMMDWKSIIVLVLCFSSSNAFSLFSSSRIDKVFPQFHCQNILSKQRTTPLYFNKATEIEEPKSIYVVGSVNADIVVSIPRLPASGETLLGSGGQVLPGGKGANQAVAAARLAKTRFPSLNVNFIGVFGVRDLTQILIFVFNK